MSVARSPGGTPLLTMEMLHDPAISAALGMPTDADAYVFTVRQAHQLRRALGRLLDGLRLG